MNNSDYEFELKSISDEILNYGISSNRADAIKLAKEWLEQVSDPFSF